MATLNLLVDGGNAKPSPSVSQQVGPLGINLGKLMQDINKETGKYQGMKVPVVVEVDAATREYKIIIKNPPASQLLKKEIGLDKGAKDIKIKVGNIALEQVIKVAKMKQQDMFCDKKEAVKSVLGTCVSLGLLVESKHPKKVIREINQGLYKNEIEKENTEVSDAKKKKLQQDFEKLQKILEKKFKEAPKPEAAVAGAAAPAEGEVPATEKTDVKAKAKPAEKPEKAKKK